MTDVFDVDVSRGFSVEDDQIAGLFLVSSVRPLLRGLNIHVLVT